MSITGVGALTGGVVATAPSHSVLGAAYTIFLFLLVFVVGYGQSHANGAGALGFVSLVLAGSWPVVVVFAALSHRLGNWLRARTSLFLLAWVVLPVGIVFVLNFWKQNVLLQRYLIISSPAVFILIAAALSQLVRRRALAVAVAAVFAILAGATVLDNLDVGNQAREDWRSAAAIVERERAPGDAVVIMPWFYVTPFDYYFHGRLPVAGLHSEERGVRLTTRVDLPRLARGHKGKSLWVVIAYESVFDPTGRIRSSLNHQFHLTARYRLGGEMELRRYRVR